jgi:hypothetical protein
MEGDVLLEGERVRLKVIHNGGDNCIDARLEEEMKHCDIVILLFDIANKPTMEKLKTKVTRVSCVVCVYLVICGWSTQQQQRRASTVVSTCPKLERISAAHADREQARPAR